MAPRRGEVGICVLSAQILGEWASLHWTISRALTTVPRGDFAHSKTPRSANTCAFGEKVVRVGDVRPLECNRRSPA